MLCVCPALFRFLPYMSSIDLARFLLLGESIDFLRAVTQFSCSILATWHFSIGSKYE
jgi:hypothetical protein